MKCKRLLAGILSVLMIIAPFSAWAEEDAEKTFSVSSVTPYDGQKNVSPVNLKMDITFSEAVDAKTLNIGNVSVSNNAYGAIVASGEKSATVYFKRDNITPGEKYTVTLKKGIKSASGASLEETKVTFTVSQTMPKGRQITNGDMSDVKFLQGYGGDTAGSVKIVNENGNPVMQLLLPWNEAAIKQKVFCTAGETYTTRVRVKSNTAQKAWVALVYYVPGDADFYHGSQRILLTPNQWTDIECSWSLPENAIVSDVTAMVSAESAGTTIWIDDWTFYSGNNDYDEISADGSAEMQYTVIAKDENSLEKLKALKIMSRSIYEKSEISRLELAKTALKLLDIEPMEIPEEITFEDVSEDEKGVVATVNSMGIMHGASDKEFNPDGAATVAQAMKIILTAMGYKPLAESKGGYPGGYMQVASSLGLTKGVGASQDETIKGLGFANLLDNALDTEVLSVFSYGEKEGPAILKGNKLMNAYMSIEKAVGIIEVTEETDLYGSRQTAMDTVIINDTLYFCDADVSGYIGCKVDYYYYTDEYDEKHILYISGIEKRNKIADFSTNTHDISYSGSVYKTVSFDDKSKSYTVKSNKKVIYNGRYVGTYTNDILVPDYGSVRLIDSGNGYDTVIITNIETFLVGAVDSDKERVYDSINNNYVDFSLYEIVVITDIEGNEYTPKDIKQDTVLSVIRSGDNKVVKAYISKDTVKGTLCNVEEEGNGYVLTLGDLQYGDNVRADYPTVPVYFTNLQFGSSGVFYLDFNGRIAAFGTIKSEKKAGYLFSAKYVADSEEVWIKIFNEDTNFLNVKGAAKMKIDGTTVKKPENAVEMLKNGTNSVVPQLVLYETDSAGNISYIDTAYNKQPLAADYLTVTPGNESKDSFRITYSNLLEKTEKKIMFTPSSRSFSNKVLLSASPTIFVVPEDVTSDRVKFNVIKNYWALGNRKNSCIEAYQLSADSFVTDYLVVYLDNNSYNTNDLNGYGYGLVVSNKLQLIEETGEVVYVITLADGKKIYSREESLITGIDPGDCMRYRTDKESYLVENALRVFDASEVSACDVVSEYTRINHARVYEKRGSVIGIVSDSVNITSRDEVNKEMKLYDCAGATFWVYDMGRKKIERGTINDVLDYKSANSKRSDILMMSYEGAAKTVLVINQ